MATTLSSPLPDPGGCLICQRLALAVVLVDLANTSKEIIRCFSITARFAGSHRSLRPDTARLPVQSVPVAIRQKWESAAFSGVRDRKSTRLNSSHPSISYAVFCLKKKSKTKQRPVLDRLHLPPVIALNASH